MLNKLDFIQEKYKELSDKVSDPEIIADQPVWQKHMKEMGEMEPIVNKYKEYKKAEEDLTGAKDMLSEGGLDDEIKELAKSLKFYCCRKIPTMKKMLYSKSGREPAERKRLFSVRICSECI